MSLPIFLHCLAVFLAIFMAGYALSKWGSPRTLYFTCYAVSIAIYAVGALLEVTAASTDAAIVACKVQYFGLPYVGPFFFLFCMDYAGSTARRRWVGIALNIFPLVCTVLVAAWPYTRLYYQNLTLAVGAPANHLTITAGPVYPLAMAYNALVMLAGVTIVVHHYLKDRQRALRHLVVFGAATLLPAAAMLLRVFETFRHWDIMPLALALNCVILGYYMIRFRRVEWTTIGRGAAVQQMKDAFVLVDCEGRFLDANQAAKAYFPKLAKAAPGLGVGEVEGFPAELLSHATDDYEFTLGTGNDLRYMRASRSPLTVNGRESGTIIIIYDNTENKHLVNELQQMATHDALTGLYNRGTFFKYAERDFDLSRRKLEDGSVLMMDIDHFKRVNDEHGHQAGDRVLQAIATTLRARLRHTDISGRYGGEELAVWLPDAASEGAAIIADVLRRAVEHMVFDSEHGRFHVTISIGVAGLDHARHQNFDQLIAEADIALYQAKNEGRNRVCTFHQADRPAPDFTEPGDACQIKMPAYHSGPKELQSPADID